MAKNGHFGKTEVMASNITQSAGALVLIFDQRDQIFPFLGNNDPYNQGSLLIGKSRKLESSAKRPWEVLWAKNRLIIRGSLFCFGFRYSHQRPKTRRVNGVNGAKTQITCFENSERG